MFMDLATKIDQRLLVIVSGRREGSSCDLEQLVGSRLGLLKVCLPDTCCEKVVENGKNSDLCQAINKHD